ncbi:MAG: sugar phosphate isomerase/epimerase [Clostridia bacterium]|nr:sugar phosphate isomerase/epimerase [Clostridia bacterium]
MKLGIAMSTYQSEFGPITFRIGTNEDKLKQISSIGYNGTDLFSHELTSSETEGLKRLLEKYNVGISMFIPFFLAELKLSFTDPDDDKRTYFINRYKEQILTASRLGARTMPIGFIRGRLLPADTFDAYRERLARSLLEVSAHAADLGVALCLEPINSNEINTFYHACDAYDFLNEYNLGNMRLLLDSYHIAYEYKPQDEIIRYCADKISHYHVSDTERLLPGEGRIDYKSIISALAGIGYEGYLSIEADAAKNTFDRAQAAYGYLAGILKGYK